MSLPTSTIIKRGNWVLGCVAVLTIAGCGSSESDTGVGVGGATTASGGEGGKGGEGGLVLVGGGGSGGGETPCVNLECQQVACSGSATTSISGTIYDPSGTLPLYNVGVYVPNAPLDPVEDGLSCDTCDGTFSGSPLVSAITDTQGRFTIPDMPVGEDIPLVIQVGKWRRQIVIPAVEACVDTALTDAQQTRLPKSMAEGNLPRIALSTGDADPLFCLLRRLGIDDSEYGIAGSEARVHFFRGFNGSSAFDAGFGASPGATFPSAPSTLWASDWENYDIAMLSCEGDEYPGAKNGNRAGLVDYINAGGRVFATHYHYNWFQGDAPADLKSVANFTSSFNPFAGLVDIDQTFPKGMALAEWLVYVDGTSPLGQFNVVDGRRHTLSVDANLARVWARYQNDIEYFSFNAPIGAEPEAQCGRMVFSDIHVSAGAGNPSQSFPSACSTGPLTEQEKALIFMFFDLSACLIPDDEPICPPGQPACGGAGDPECSGQCINGCCSAVPN